MSKKISASEIIKSMSATNAAAYGLNCVYYNDSHDTEVTETVMTWNYLPSTKELDEGLFRAQELYPNYASIDICLVAYGYIRDQLVSRDVSIDVRIDRKVETPRPKSSKDSSKSKSTKTTETKATKTKTAKANSGKVGKTSETSKKKSTTSNSKTTKSTGTKATSTASKTKAKAKVETKKKSIAASSKVGKTTTGSKKKSK